MKAKGIRAGAVIALVALAALTACDDDPNSPQERLTLTACPTGAQDVNSPVTLDFSVPLLPSSVAAGNVVVTDALTGLEIPGSLSVDPSAPNRVRFTPSSPFRFSQDVRIRIQRLLSAGTRSEVPVTVCELTTQPPPITELFWRALPSAGGLRLNGVSLAAKDTGYALSQLGVLFARDSSGDFTVRYQQPYFSAGFDVDFVSRNHGFMAMQDFRTNQSLLLETNDAGVTFDSIGVVPSYIARRIAFRQVGTPATIFGLVGGGNTGITLIYKWRPESRTLTQQLSSTSSGYPNDLAIATNDTTRAVAVTNGIRVGSFVKYGRVYVSLDGGSSWTEVAGMQASDSTLTYFGAAMRGNGEVWVSGGNGYLARLTPTGPGTYSVARVSLPGLTSFNAADPFALLLTDVEFARDNDQIGWVIGAQQVGVENGQPRYQGVIYRTRDGGGSWTRQGVFGANNYGAEFPRLNRLSVLSSTAVWIAGDGGTVLSYQP